ncbi:MAG: hypothetical protein ACK4RK_19220 [Gemmataceae bacterium]
MPATLCWAVIIFVAAQGALGIGTEQLWPGLRDPEYGKKLALVRAVRSAHPNRELLLVLGSSRTAVGLRPALLDTSETRNNGSPLVFNFGMTAAGPIRELLHLRRLLRDGVRPDGLVIEMLPTMLNQPGHYNEANHIPLTRLTWNDLPLIARYRDGQEQTSAGFTPATGVHRQWCQANVVPVYAQRFVLMSRCLPAWLPHDKRTDFWEGLDAWGWFPFLRRPSDAENHRALDYAQREHAELLHHYDITEPPNRAVREMLSICQKENIPVVLLIMPESRVFRGWYGPQTEEKLGTYLRQLRHEFGVPCIDARAWISDEHFLDGHHLLPDGAALFTQRFGVEVVPMFQWQ